jgi:pilus assembly protein Flp/PilA
MTQFSTAVQQFIQDEEGITAIEYGLIAAVMVGFIGVVFTLLRQPLTDLFTAIGDKLVIPAAAP